MRILLIGTGATAGAYYRLFQKALRGSTQGHDISATVVEVWDKARGFGGRMSTSRSSQVENAKADLGAQYLTLYESDNSELYDVLEEEGVIQRFHGGFEGQHSSQRDRDNYIAPNGISSVIKALFQGKFDIGIACCKKQTTMRLTSYSPFIMQVLPRTLDRL